MKFLFVVLFFMGVLFLGSAGAQDTSNMVGFVISVNTYDTQYYTLGESNICSSVSECSSMSLTYSQLSGYSALSPVIASGTSTNTTSFPVSTAVLSPTVVNGQSVYYISDTPIAFTQVDDWSNYITENPQTDNNIWVNQFGST